MKICLQDPNDPTYCLHEELLLASANSTFGAAVFAFVSKGGVNLLIEDEIFLKFITNSPFFLIIGTDEITNTKTLESLKILIDRYPKLQVKAFLNIYSNATFHPKYCWFKQFTGGNIIIGSGNLTQQGLRRNWEAYSVLKLNVQEIDDFEKQWNEWLLLNDRFLRSINDPEVIKRVAENNRIIKRIKPEESCTVVDKTEPYVTITEEESEEESEAWVFDSDSLILIAEIPKASNRWNQANFDRNNFVDFFGATPGDNTLRVLFRGLTIDKKLLEVEVRQSVSVRSHNWRFELDLAKDKEYPKTGRPTGVFVRVSKRMFLYMLIMPTDNEYAAIIDLLNSRSTSGIRRFQFSCNEVREMCSDLAIWDFME